MVFNEHNQFKDENTPSNSPYLQCIQHVSMHPQLQRVWLQPLSCHSPIQ